MDNDLTIIGTKNTKAKKKRLRKKIHLNKISCHDKFIKNPCITRFNENSLFIYDNDMAEEYLSSIKNKNLIKLNEKEIEIIQNLIDEINFEKVLSKKENIIYIEKALADDINNYFKIEESNNTLKSFLIGEIKNSEDRNDFTLRKLSKKYYEVTGNKASRTTIHNYLTKRMGYRYLKSSVKTKQIL